MNGGEMAWLMIVIGCFTEFDKLPQINQNDLPFEHPYLENKNVSVSMISTSLLCPDGKQSSVFAVYPQREEPLPVAIVFHPDAVSYVTSYLAEIDERPTELTSEWGEAKLWETLGMSRESNSEEGNGRGALAAALADSDFVQLYPMNCWGDYWHGLPGTHDNAEALNQLPSDEPNDSGEDNSEETAGANENNINAFVRRGLEMAQLTVSMVLEPTIAGEQGFNIPQSTNPDNLTLIGLGSGSRAVVELLLTGANPQAVVFDSGPLELQPYLEQTDAFAYERQTIERVFADSEGNGLSNVNQWSAAAIETLPTRTALVWSNGDSRIPQASVSDMAANLQTQGRTQIDQNVAGHIFSASDITVAKSIVNFINTGTYGLPNDGDGDTGATESD